MAKSTVKDLTVGSPMKLILSFMLPLLFGLLFSTVLTMVVVPTIYFLREQRREQKANTTS